MKNGDLLKSGIRVTESYQGCKVTVNDIGCILVCICDYLVKFEKTWNLEHVQDKRVALVGTTNESKLLKLFSVPGLWSRAHWRPVWNFWWKANEQLPQQRRTVCRGQHFFYQCMEARLGMLNYFHNLILSAWGYFKFISVCMSNSFSDACLSFFLGMHEYQNHGWWR